MSSKFGILGICQNPTCGKSFKLADPDSPGTALNFNTLGDALVMIDGLERPDPLREFGSSEQPHPADKLPLYVECEHCDAIFPRESVEYFPLRLSGVRGDFPERRTDVDDMFGDEHGIDANGKGKGADTD